MRMWMVDPSLLCRKHLLGEKRGYNHKSELPKYEYSKSGHIDITNSINELINRCPDCRKLIKE